jgi:carbonic anhydrase
MTTSTIPSHAIIHHKALIPQAQQALDTLLEGNARFREGRPKDYYYTPDTLSKLSQTQQPIAAIVGCADSRVSPEVIFDQPLGKIFASRVPGNVASDSAKWMLDIAVQEFKVPLVLVMGHTGCLAVGQLLEGDKGGSGGNLRHAVLNAVYEARTKRPKDLFKQAVVENALQTVRHLIRDSYVVQRALKDNVLDLRAAYYDMATGEVHVLEEPAPTF